MDITNKIDQFLDEAYEKVKGTKMEHGKFYSDFMEVKKAFTNAKDAKEYYTAVKSALELVVKMSQASSGYNLDWMEVNNIRLINDAEKDLVKLSSQAVDRLKLSSAKKINLRDFDGKRKDVLKRIMTAE
jgi:predicted O-linked N-acetylglucosamine transferase (SPINDLY family)